MPKETAAFFLWTICEQKRNKTVKTILRSPLVFYRFLDYHMNTVVKNREMWGKMVTIP